MRPFDGAALFPGAERALAAHRPPQPDQLCGPFAASVGLAAVLDDPPSVVALALAAGTRIWPHDVPSWRPAGAAHDRTGWDDLPLAANEEESGTDRLGLARGIESATSGRVRVDLPVPGTVGELEALLGGLLDGPPEGVLANLRTGPVLPPGADPSFDVGHFVVLLGLTDTGEVVVADSYRELGADGWPPACRPVAVLDLQRALVARGLLLLSHA